jgi:CHAD domain-containing protein
VPQQHRARKRLKRLRYALEFVAPLLPAHPLKRWHRVLAKALAALGDHNDLQTARDYFASQVAQDAQAWFAVGWLSAQDEASTGRAQAALAKLKAQRRPWRKA